MKKLFYGGILGLLLFEITNVYFIMPIPGSQEMNSIDLAYFLYSWRWLFRVIFVLFIFLGFDNAVKSSRILAIISLIIVAGRTPLISKWLPIPCF